MMPHPWGGWRVFQQIVADPWDALAHAHPRDQTPYDEGLVATRLAVAPRSRGARSQTAACGVARAPIGWRGAAKRHGADAAPKSLATTGSAR